jgi:glycosyltransferase involved in cell wall biosynthesis
MIINSDNFKMKNTQYPKVLIISHTPLAKSSVGKTLCSLFSTWPKDKIAQLFFHSSEICDSEFCNNYFRLTDNQVLRGLFKKDKNDCYSNSIELINTNNRINTNKDNRRNIINFNSAKFGFNLLLFRDLLWSIDSKKLKNAFEWIENINPDLVFFVGGASGFSHKIAHEVVQEFNIPLFNYILDDNYINPRINNPLKYLQYYLNTKPSIEKTIRLSKINFVIGDLMAEDYKNIFNKQFIPIMNSNNFENQTYYVPNLERNDKILLTYIGGLHFNRWQSLIYLGDLLREIQKEHLLNISFEIFSFEKINDNKKYLLNQPPLTFLGSISNDMVRQKHFESDILVHVESINAEYRKAMKYSVSTKIPEYLSSGNCVIAYGPAEGASLRVLGDNDLGIVLTDNDSREEKKEKLINILTNKAIRNYYGKRGYDYAFKKYNTLIVGELLQKTFSENI